MTKQPELLVIDASFVAKWFVKEPDSEKSYAVLNQIERGRWKIIAPALLRWELANVFRKKKLHGYSKEQFLEAWTELERLGLNETPIHQIFTIALDVAFAFNVNVYDACYVALAEIHSAPLATFDKELNQKISE